MQLHIKCTVYFVTLFTMIAEKAAVNSQMKGRFQCFSALILTLLLTSMSGFGQAPSINTITPGEWLASPVRPSVTLYRESVTIEGSDFGAAQSGSTVSFGEITGTPLSWSDTRIVVPVPANAPAGFVNVAVTVNGVASNTKPFIATVAQEAVSFTLMDERLKTIAGKEAINCGTVELNEDTKAANGCVRRAFSRRKTFYVRYDDAGMDQSLSNGLAGDASGNIFTIGFGTAGFGSPSREDRWQLLDHGHSVVEECPKPIHFRKFKIKSRKGLTCLAPKPYNN